ncbi:MAG: DUF116 domain-containing protein [Candidatus Sumerlaeaceae bacterium]|nr:DUF116 domain-containing protein [Candidatus Sumerlaeaceae bacterium]
MNFEQNLNDRKLGHEWYGWDGNIDSHEAFIQEPKRLFMGMFFSAFALVLAASCFIVWGFYLRLVTIHPLLGDVALGAIAVFTATFAVIYGSLSYALVFHKPNRLAEATCQRLFKIFPAVSALSSHFGISKDRLGYSLVEIHNELTKNRIRECSNGRILCLAPRCLDRENVEQIKAMMAEYDCDFYMAPTGAQARQKIVQAKPAAIIGIACERDLVTGIRDVGYRIPVIGVTNKRPAGPCKGAFIDLHELREAIEVFKERFELVERMEDEVPAEQPQRV